MTATAMRTPVPRERNTLDADRADPPVRPVAVSPRNGLPEPRFYRYRGADSGDAPLEDGSTCQGCGGESVVTADRRVRIRHNRPCAVEERLRARRDRSAAA